MTWHYADLFGSKELNSEVLETGINQVFSLVGFLFPGGCWIGSQAIYLASFPSWFVCVWMWLGRNYSLRCYMGEKQRKTSLKEQCKEECIFLWSLYKSLPGQTSLVLNILPNQVTAKFCSCVQGFSLPFLSPALVEKWEPLLCLEACDIQVGCSYSGQSRESKLPLIVS